MICYLKHLTYLVVSKETWGGGENVQTEMIDVLGDDLT